MQGALNRSHSLSFALASTRRDNHSLTNSTQQPRPLELFVLPFEPKRLSA